MSEIEVTDDEASEEETHRRIQNLFRRIRVLHLKVKHAKTDHWLEKNLTLENRLQVFKQVHSLMSAVFGENVEDSSSDSNAQRVRAEFLS